MPGTKQGFVGSPIGSAARSAVGSDKSRRTMGNFLTGLGGGPATSFLHSLGVGPGMSNKSINRLSDRRKNRLGK
jgi:hypothetical protein